jgi:hypothetical protein
MVNAGSLAGMGRETTTAGEHFMRSASALKRSSYRKSQALEAPGFTLNAHCLETARTLHDAMNDHDELAISRASQQFVTALCKASRVPDKIVTVAGKRQQRGRGEIHGLCEMNGRITIYLYTAKRGLMVAFKTYLKTLIHEFMHHYDWKGLKIQSMHTAGFYKRVNHVYKHVLADLGLIQN